MCIITTDQLDFSQSNLEDNFIQIQPLDNTKTDEIEPIEADKETSNEIEPIEADNETSNEIEPIEADNETSNGTNTSDGKKTFDDKETSDGSEAVDNNINEGNLTEAVCEEEANLSNFKNSTRRTSGRQKKEVCESN